LIFSYKIIVRVVYRGVFKGRQARHLPRAPFATVVCKVAYLVFQWDPTAIAMYKWATLLSKAPKVTVMHFSFKNPLTSLISNDSYVSIWGIEPFFWVLSGDGTGIFGPL